MIRYYTERYSRAFRVTVGVRRISLFLLTNIVYDTSVDVNVSGDARAFTVHAVSARGIVHGRRDMKHIELHVVRIILHLHV